MSKRHIFIDPSGMLGRHHWCAVIVKFETGVIYEHQYGGSQNLQGRIEGYWVPLDGGAGLERLMAIFADDLEGSGIRGNAPADVVERIGEAVSGIYFFGATSTPDAIEEPGGILRIDEGRQSDLNEAWIPVLTIDGPAVLIWPNSD